MTTSIYSLVIIVVFAALLDTAFGCSCVRETGFGICSSDFAIRGTVLNVTGNQTLQEDWLYAVRIEETYKVASNDTTVNSTIMIESPGHTCGVDLLEEGLIYLISGLYENANPPYFIDRCNSVVKQYTDEDDEDDVGLPCSGSSISITSHLVAICTILHHLLR